MDAAVADRQLFLTPSAALRVQKLKAMEGKDGLMLRLSVSGGGCSGFSYSFSLEETRNPDDRIFEQHDVTLVVDETSLELLHGATVDFVDGLMGSSFTIDNPNAASTCGCGTSFSV